MTQRKKTYLTNKDKKIGDNCICPICKSGFVKSHYAQAFCCNECKVKYHNDKQRGKRNDYFRKYNLEHPDRYERVGIDLTFEKWKAEYYRECSCFGELPLVTIDDEELYKQFRNI